MKYQISCVIEAKDEDDARDIVKSYAKLTIKDNKLTFGQAFAQGKYYGIKEQKEMEKFKEVIEKIFQQGYDLARKEAHDYEGD